MPEREYRTASATLAAFLSLRGHEFTCRVIGPSKKPFFCFEHTEELEEDLDEFQTGGTVPANAYGALVITMLNLARRKRREVEIELEQGSRQEREGREEERAIKREKLTFGDEEES